MSGGKTIVLLGVGVLIGLMATAAAMSAWQQRNALPKGAMALMQYHLSKARRAAGTHCYPERARQHLQRLDAISNDAIEIFAALGQDRFAIEQRAFARVVTDARSAPDCATLSTGIKMVADACDACHHNLR